MCSNVEDFEAVSPLPAGIKGQRAKARKCVSCSEESVLVVRGVNGYCLSCYHETCRHKFRATIGKSKKIVPGDRVLVWLWPPLGAAAAVALLEETRQDTKHKKLQFDFEYAVVAFQKDSCNIVLDVGICLSAIHRITCDGAPPQRNSTLRLAHEVIDAFKAIVRFAKRWSFNKVFTCETGGDLAQQMLMSVALGRGCQLPDIIGLSAERDGITLLRPLREFSDEEVEKYLRSRNLPVPTVSKLPPSMQRLTRDFVNGLQADFPSTVPTIWRTGDKISVSSKGSLRCAFCGYNFPGPESFATDTDIKTSVRGAMDARQVSARLSTAMPPQENAEKISRWCHSCRQMNLAE